MSVPAFRRYKSHDEPSWLPVIAVFILGAFDVGIIAYLLHALWMLRS